MAITSTTARITVLFFTAGNGSRNDGYSWFNPLEVTFEFAEGATH